MDYSKLVRELVQSIMGLSLIATTIYLAISGELPMEFFCSLVGVAVGFFMAERKNGIETQHIERMKGADGKWQYPLK